MTTQFNPERECLQTAWNLFSQQKKYLFHTAKTAENPRSPRSAALTATTAARSAFTGAPRCGSQHHTMAIKQILFSLSYLPTPLNKRSPGQAHFLFQLVLCWSHLVSFMSGRWVRRSPSLSPVTQTLLKPTRRFSGWTQANTRPHMDNVAGW